MFSPRTAVTLIFALGLTTQVAATPITSPASSLSPAVIGPVHIIEEITVDDGAAKLVLYGAGGLGATTTARLFTNGTAPPPQQPSPPPEDLCHRGPLGCTGVVPGPKLSLCDSLIENLERNSVGARLLADRSIVGICRYSDDWEASCCTSWTMAIGQPVVPYSDLIATAKNIRNACVAHGSGGWASDVTSDGHCMIQCMSTVGNYCGLV